MGGGGEDDVPLERLMLDSTRFIHSFMQLPRPVNASDYAAVSRRLEEEGLVRLVMEIPNARYIAEEGAHYWIYGRGPRA